MLANAGGELAEQPVGAAQLLRRPAALASAAAKPHDAGGTGSQCCQPTERRGAAGGGRAAGCAEGPRGRDGGCRGRVHRRRRPLVPLVRLVRFEPSPSGPRAPSARRAPSPGKSACTVACRLAPTAVRWEAEVRRRLPACGHLHECRHLVQPVAQLLEKTNERLQRPGAAACAGHPHDEPKSARACDRGRSRRHRFSRRAHPRQERAQRAPPAPPHAAFMTQPPGTSAPPRRAHAAIRGADARAPFQAGPLCRPSPRHPASTGPRVAAPEWRSLLMDGSARVSREDPHYKNLELRLIISTIVVHLASRPHAAQPSGHLGVGGGFIVHALESGGLRHDGRRARAA